MSDNLADLNAILAALNERRDLSNAEVQEATNLPQEVSDRVLKSLVEDGFVTPVLAIHPEPHLLHRLSIRGLGYVQAGFNVRNPVERALNLVHMKVTAYDGPARKAVLDVYESLAQIPYRPGSPHRAPTDPPA